MKRLIIPTILVIMAGCAPFEPSPEVKALCEENQRIIADSNLLIQDFNDLKAENSNFMSEELLFLNNLNDEQLKAYQEFRATTTTVDIVIKCKKLTSLLSEEQNKKVVELLDKSIDLSERARNISARYQSLQKQFQQLNEKALITYGHILAQQRQGKMMWQMQSMQSQQNFQNMIWRQQPTHIYLYDSVIRH